MTPVFLICPPRAKGTLLMRMLDATPGVWMNGEGDAFIRHLRALDQVQAGAHYANLHEDWPRHRHQANPLDFRDQLRALFAAWVSPPPNATHYGLRLTYLGREGWKEAVDWWSWLLAFFPGAKFVFLTRNQAEIELSMLATAKLWRPSYGTCAGGCGGRVKQFMKSAAMFCELNPSATALLDAADLADFDKTAAVLQQVGIPLDRHGWEREFAIVSGSRKQLGDRFAEVVKPEHEGSPFHSDFDFKAALAKQATPADALEEFKRDPFGQAAADLASWVPKKPRPFVPFPHWHESAIVIPYLAAEAVADELRFALRSLHRFCTDQTSPIYVIGDRPPSWLKPGGRVRFLPIDYRLRKDRRRAKDLGLWRARWVGLQLAKRTLWLMDDIVFLRAFGWSDCELPVAEGRLDGREADLLATKHTPFRHGLGSSSMDLRKAGFQSVFRFAAHSPCVYEASNMVSLFRRFHVPFSGALENLYFHLFWRGRRDNRIKARLLPDTTGALFLNVDNARFRASRPHLKAMFPDPAPWEVDNGPAIPRIIHQTWKDADIPARIYPHEWQQSWRQHHPGWEYRLWTDADLLALAEAHYPEFTTLFREARGIIKADVGRLLVLHRHGGLYADLDYQALGSLEELLTGATAFVSSIPRPERRYIHNALMAGGAGHSMFLGLARLALKRWEGDPDGPAEWISGPDLLTTFADRWNPQHLPAELVCPIDWHIPRREWRPKLDDIATHFPKALALTRWVHNWSNPADHRPAFGHALADAF